MSGPFEIFKAVTGEQDDAKVARYLQTGTLEEAVENYFNGTLEGDLVQLEGDFVQWESIDPRTGQHVKYPKDVCERLERAFQSTEKEPVSYIPEGTSLRFHICVRSMRQFNSSCHSRGIRRLGPVQPLPEVVHITRPRRTYEEAIKLIDAVTREVCELISNPDKPMPDTLRMPTQEQKAFIVDIFNDILARFKYCSKCRTEFGHVDGDEQALDDPVLTKVPDYFANVKGGETIYKRKVLSLLGLRNLVFKGEEIFNELRKKHFSGDASLYGPMEGISKMKYFTGNVVDLDTVVLRCTERSLLKQVNDANMAEGKPTFRSGEEFANSEQAKEMAYNAARFLIDQFLKRLQFSFHEQHMRKIVLGKNDKVPVARDNSSRGKWAMWQYINADAGVNTFHVNVPDMADVYGALLVAPWHAVRAYCTIMLEFDEKDMPEMLFKYFDDCIADSCFNAKWKSIEAFCDELTRTNTIDRVLANIHRQHQKVIDTIIEEAGDDVERYKEEITRFTCELVSKHCLQGHGSDGKMVGITREMVADWIQRTTV
eukprot:TRINITY_DN17344_c0_g1_i1.p1 TRINITY_DN17344_c0_g1~~TRINITY_DN17344_c0_g1_i1.p1  ORF type:complete len:551 (+),score=149.65 TRINITY_DN17344_c0_g1_i1:32-1654(+)